LHHPEFRLARPDPQTTDSFSGAKSRRRRGQPSIRHRSRSPATAGNVPRSEGAAPGNTAVARRRRPRADGDVVSVPPSLFDTHAHLDDEKFRDDLPAVLERARAAGVCRIVTVATTAPTSRICVDLAARHSDILVPTVGIQPNNVAEAAPGDWDEVVRLATAERVVALGETGLDRYWD